MALPIDFKIDKTIKRIQNELSKNNIEVSYETILAVINQQVDSTITGMENGHTVVWKYFGTFVATQKRVDSLNKFYSIKGKKPTLVDNGFARISFTRQGEEVTKSTFEGTSKKDLLT